MTTFYHSTRSAGDSVTSKQAILAGIAPDGGLYVGDALADDPAKQKEIIKKYLAEVGSLHA